MNTLSKDIFLVSGVIAGAFVVTASCIRSASYLKSDRHAFKRCARICKKSDYDLYEMLKMYGGNAKSLLAFLMYTK